MWHYCIGVIKAWPSPIHHPGRLAPDSDKIVNKNCWRNNLHCHFARKMLVFVRLFLSLCKQTLMHYNLQKCFCRLFLVNVPLFLTFAERCGRKTICEIFFQIVFAVSQKFFLFCRKMKMPPGVHLSYPDSLGLNTSNAPW